MDTTVFPGCEASLRSDVLAYAAKRYGSRPEALWRTRPRYAVLRRPDSQKWYALVMDVPRDKLRIPGPGSAGCPERPSATRFWAAPSAWSPVSCPPTI